MSLNGLGEPSIKEAHDSAVSQPGGWLLLKYASRDEIELFVRGNGGADEMRNAITRYAESSPLFGFLRYRRRNVLVKYVPNECSRLVQARVTVHFSAISDYFSPYDTIFSMTSPSELYEVALSAACSLHTASASTSSSTSSPCRQRLMEIAEEEEVIKWKRESTTSEMSKGETCTARAISISESSTAIPINDHTMISTGPLTRTTETNNTSHLSRECSDARPHTSSHDNFSRYDQTLSEDLDYPSFNYSGRSKVRLGPRPSQDAVMRPYASSSSFHRPVSTLPAGLKSFAKGSRHDRKIPTPSGDLISRNKYLNPPAPLVPNVSLTSSTTISDSLNWPSFSNERPNTSSSGLSFRSMQSQKVSINSKTQSLDMARARLMRAQELRRKKLDGNKILDTNPKLSDPKLLEMTPPASPLTALNCDPALTELDDGLSKHNDQPLSVDSKSHTGADIPYLISVSSEDLLARSPEYNTTVLESIEATSKAGSTKEISSGTSKDTISSCNITKSNTTDILKAGRTESDLNTFGTMYPQIPLTYELMDIDFSNITLATDAEIPENKEISAAIVLENRSYVEPSLNLSENCSIISPPSYKSESLNSTNQNEISYAESRSSELSLEEPDHALTLKEEKSCKMPRSDINEQTQVHFPLTSEQSLDELIVTPAESKTSCQLPPSIKLSMNTTAMCPMEKLDQNVVEEDCNFSSDDELMDELQSAIIEDAKPIAVTKSSVNLALAPTHPSKKENDSTVFPRLSVNPVLRREFSNPHSVGSARSENLRSVSTSAIANRENTTSNLHVVKKINLGSGISQRIKALEKLSTLSPDDNMSSGTTAGIPTFFSVRKTSVRVSSKSRTKCDKLNSQSRTNLLIKPDDPSTSSSIKSINDVPWATESISSPLSDSFPISTHIIKDPSLSLSIASEAGKNQADLDAPVLPDTLGEIEHNRINTVPGGEAPESGKANPEKHTGNLTSNFYSKKRRSSLTVLKDIFTERRVLASESRRSMSHENLCQASHQKSSTHQTSLHTDAGKVSIQSYSTPSRRSSSNREAMNMISLPISTSSVETTFDDKGENKSSRTSRILHKMSSSITASRKSILQAISSIAPEVPETNTAPNTKAQKSSTLSDNVITVGDVNVQFPDSLLWKRKTMLLDAFGFLILAPVMSEYHHESSKDKPGFGGMRKFHLSEFKKPFVPDVEIEELPNSVILDFIEGETLQIACQDRFIQAHILSILQAGHDRCLANL